MAGLTTQQLADLATPREFDAMTVAVLPQAIAERIRVSAGVSQQLEWLERDVELGFEAIYLNHVGANLAKFIDAFGERVVPQLTGAGC